MPRRPSISTLMARTLTALLTVWCLGCSGFDPLLGAIMGRTSGMTCQSDTRMDRQPESAAPSVSAASVTASSSTFDCGCGSCHSTAPNNWTVALAHDAPVFAHDTVRSDLLSVTLALTAPPPKSLA